jgi:NADH-quinone oxidoreductase subunit N
MTLTYDELTALLPLLVTSAASVVVMIGIACYRSHRLTATLTMAGLGLAILSLVPAAEVAPKHATALLTIDRYALFYMGLVLAAALVTAMLAYGYLERQKERPEEFYLLLLLATLGSAVLVASSHFATFFLGLEILSVSLYALVAYPRARLGGIEAAIKYLVVAGVSSAFLLFGMALIYADTGTMEFSQIAYLATGGTHIASVLALAGTGMVLVGIGFKLALVPFHLWTPDVYQGAPAPVTAFIATVSKGAVFALLLRYFTLVPFHPHDSLVLVFMLLAVLSMLGGNLLALRQNDVKRILAYSSIAHLGYLMVAFLASGLLAATAVTYYLVAYFITTLGAFGVVTVLSGGSRDAGPLEDFRGLAWRRPWLAGVMTAMVLSLAGIPLTAGFVGKFYVLAAGAGAALWGLLIVLAVASAIGLFYYLRIVVAIFSAPEAEAESERPAPARVPLTFMAGLALAVLTLLLVWLGVYPAPMIDFIQTSVAGLF